MKILVIHTAFIGDIVLSTPLIQKIRDIYPDSEIDYLTLPGNRSIISNNPNLRDIILYDKKGADRGIKGFFRILKIVKNNKYDLAIIPHSITATDLCRQPFPAHLTLIEFIYVRHCSTSAGVAL